MARGHRRRRVLPDEPERQRCERTGPRVRHADAQQGHRPAGVRAPATHRGARSLRTLPRPTTRVDRKRRSLVGPGAAPGRGARGEEARGISGAVPLARRGPRGIRVHPLRIRPASPARSRATRSTGATRASTARISHSSVRSQSGRRLPAPPPSPAPSASPSRSAAPGPVTVAGTLSPGREGLCMRPQIPSVPATRAGPAGCSGRVLA